MAKEETKGTATRKIRNLRKQYNKILIQIFEDNAADCIERALDETDGAFGEHIHSIIDSALDKLRQCVIDELELSNGVEDGVEDGEDGIAADVMDTDGVAIGPGVALEIPSLTTDDDEDTTEEEDSEDDTEDD